MLKNLLGLAASVFITTLPLASNAASISSTFLSSTTGTSNIEIGDSIKFEVTITTTAGRLYDQMLWTR